jgi:NAD(P)-dependent dehydrogenase (short-subunit alcohol dehydrogenase family)
MTRGILIAGNESSLFSVVAAEAVKRVETYAFALVPNRFYLAEGAPPPAPEPTGKGVSLSWTPSSPISARTLVVAAEYRLGQISNAILVCAPPAVYRTAETLTPEEIEILVNDHIRGWFFLIRELALYFRRLGGGSLSFIAPEPGPEGGTKNAQADLLGPPALASFRTFAQGILASSANELFQVMGFSGTENAAKEEFAAWLFKIIDEGNRRNSGKWHKYSKLGFFR